jgi:hypothetical protein
MDSSHDARVVGTKPPWNLLLKIFTWLTARVIQAALARKKLVFGNGNRISDVISPAARSKNQWLIARWGSII